MGWVTADFHQYDTCFDLDRVRTVTVTLGDEKGKVHERLVFLPFLPGTADGNGDQPRSLLFGFISSPVYGFISTHRNHIIKTLMSVSFLLLQQASKESEYLQAKTVIKCERRTLFSGDRRVPSADITRDSHLGLRVAAFGPGIRMGQVR